MARSVARLVAGLVLVAVVVPSVGGCGPTSPKAGRYTIMIDPSSATRDQTYDVDIFGVANEGEYASWGSAETGAHFGGSADARQVRKPATLHWEVGDGGVKYLNANDPMWDEWLGRGAWYLVVASSREFIGPAGGRQYSKPILLPLDRRRWKTKQIEIEITNSGMQLVTRLEPPPQQ